MPKHQFDNQTEKFGDIDDNVTNLHKAMLTQMNAIALERMSVELFESGQRDHAELAMRQSEIMAAIADDYFAIETRDAVH